MKNQYSVRTRRQNAIKHIPLDRLEEDLSSLALFIYEKDRTDDDNLELEEELIFSDDKLLDIEKELKDRSKQRPFIDIAAKLFFATAAILLLAAISREVLAGGFLS